MNEKGFETEIALEENPNLVVAEENLLNTKKKLNKKVDINVLISRAQRVQDKDGRKNIFIFVFALVLLGVAGIFFTI